jgi:hypothetical protein
MVFSSALVCALIVIGAEIEMLEFELLPAILETLLVSIILLKSVYRDSKSLIVSPIWL